MIKNAKELRSALGALSSDIDVIVKKTTVSTNSDGKELLRRGASRPTLIVSGEQTGGRGRQGKTFLSPAGGLYMTLVLPVDIPLSDSAAVTSCAAVAVCRALEGFGAECGIKWVNDIYSCGRKLCGILVEAENDYSAMRTKSLVIGIGINFALSPSTGGDVSPISLSELGCTADMAEVCSSVVHGIMEMHRDGFDFSVVREEYIRRSLVLGREITFIENGTPHTGFGESIGEMGELIVHSAGETVVLSSGEISLRL